MKILFQGDSTPTPDATVRTYTISDTDIRFTRLKIIMPRSPRLNSRFINLGISGNRAENRATVD